VDNTHDGDLEIIELRTRQNNTSKWLYLDEPFPTCGMQVVAFEESSRIIGKP